MMSLFTYLSIMYIVQEGWDIGKPVLGHILKSEGFLETNDVTIFQLNKN